MFNKIRTFRKNNFHKNSSWITPRLTTTWFIVEKIIILGAGFDPINIIVGVFQMSNDIRIWENMIKSCKRSDRMSKKWIWVVLSKIDFFIFLCIKYTFIAEHVIDLGWVITMSSYKNVISKKFTHFLILLIFILCSCDEYFPKYNPWHLSCFKNNYLWPNVYLVSHIIH